MVGCPAKGTSALVVKMSISIFFEDSSFPWRRKTVSDRLNSLAIAYLRVCSSVRWLGICTIANGFPLNLVSVKTSSVAKLSLLIMLRFAVGSTDMLEYDMYCTSTIPSVEKSMYLL